MTGGRIARGAALLAGFGFLYAPMLLLVVYSFNESRLVTVWGGLSTRWYGALAGNAQLLGSLWTSLAIALSAAVIATLVGSLAALALARFGPFRLRSLLALALFAPLVLPEVILGLAFLLLFVALDIDRGFWTVTLAHATFALCFVCVVVRARLSTFDRALEEAAMDLGATPRRAFFAVTLPLIAPAIAAGFLLAFTLSFDDFVIASFASGPGATTLPMRVYSQARLGVTPEINAVATLMLAAVAVALGLAGALGGRFMTGQGRE